MNIKKLFAVLAGVSFTAQTLLPVGVMGAEYSQELQDAYNWAYGKGVTTMSPIDNANMYGAITRAEMAKMLSVYSTEVLGNTPDTSKACTFTDIDSVKGDLHDFIIESCQLGIMGQGIDAFRPYDTISRAEFGTALSRVLWGNQYEGGTPYYANHLNALKSAAIMNQIANAESTKEIRGYVMLMLMRSEGGSNVDCDDPAIALACLDPELDTYKECPAACREDANTEENVKSGDLAVNAVVNKMGSVITNGATSELDTLTFKTSEDITVKSITLERYGLSNSNSIASIWLEDEDGNKITQEKTISQSKDTVTFSIKKDYQTIENGESIIVVVSTPNPSSKADLGTNIGFKVTNIESSAKNVDLSDYSPNLYDIIDYAGTDVRVTYKGSNKTYNYEEGKAYEVAKVKLTASNAAVLVNGFTLTQDPDLAKNLDLSKYVDEVTVAVDGTELKAKSSVKRDEIKVSFDEQEIAINKSSTFAVSITLKDFDNLGAAVKLGFKASSDVDILESKNKVRVAIWNTEGAVDANGNPAHDFNELYGPQYTFMGGKITLTNVKLSSTIDAAAGSDDVVVAEGKISIGGQAVSLKTLKVIPTTTITNGGGAYDYVDSLRLVIGDEEYEANKNYEFSNVVIEEDATVKLVVDIKDLRAADENATINIKFGVKTADGTAAFNKSTWDNLKYDDITTNAAAAENLVGTINISSVKVQPAKGSLSNENTKKVEFTVNETSDETLVFKGQYTAKKNNVNLDNLAIWRTSATEPDASDDIVFNVKIDGKTVATIDNPGNVERKDDADFPPVKVEAGKSVSVEVYAVVFASKETANNLEYKLGVKGKDDGGNEAGNADKSLAPMAFVKNSTINVSTNASMKKQDLVLAAKDQNLATFMVKPSNKDSKAKLEVLKFTLGESLLNLIPAGKDVEDYIEVKVGNDADHTYTLDRDASTLLVEDIDTDVEKETEVTVNFKEKLVATPVATKYATDGNCGAGYTQATNPTAYDADGATTLAPTFYACVKSGADNEYVEGDAACTSGFTKDDTPKYYNNTGLTTAPDPTYYLCTKAGAPVDYVITLTSVNNGASLGDSYKYTRKAANSIVKVLSQEGDKTSSTKYKFEVKYAPDANNESMPTVTFTYQNTVVGGGNTKTWTNVQDGNNYSIDNGAAVNYVTTMSWTDGDGYTTTLNYNADTTADFFKVGNTDERIKAFKDSN